MSSAPSLCGRDHELSLLRAALERARAGHGAAVLLRGEPGIGKSALSGLFAEEVEQAGVLVLRGFTWELGGAPALGPLLPGLRALGVAADPALYEQPSFALWEEVVEALARTSRETPVLWLIEDLHAADLHTLDLLLFVARALPGLRALLVVTSRSAALSGDDAVARRLGALLRLGLDIELTPLSEEMIAALAQRHARLPLLGPHLSRLAELTGGNPLFVIECARELRLRGKDARIERLPSGVAHLIGAQLERLSEGAQSTLGVAAVLGQTFSAALVGQVEGTMPARIIELLTPALRAGLISETRPGAFAFTHALVREAVEGSLPGAQRSAVHARAEQALARARPSPGLLVERARHAVEGLGAVEPALAAPLVKDAVRVLSAQHAYDRAHALLHGFVQRSAELTGDAPDDDSQLSLAELSRLAGRHAECTSLCLSLIAQARPSSDAVLLARATLVLGGDTRPGIVDRRLVELLEEALRRLPESERALRVRVKGRLAAALQPAEDPGGPVAMALEAIAEARALADDGLCRETLAMAGSALVDYAPIAQRIAVARELLALAEQASDRANVLRARLRLAFDLAELGDFDACQSEVERALATSQLLGHARYRWRPLLMSSMLDCARGRFAQSERAIAEAAEFSALSDDPALMLSLAAHHLARAALKHDDDAYPSHEQLVQVCADTPDPPLYAGILALGGAVLREDVEAQRALLATLGEQVDTDPDGQSFPHILALAYAELGSDAQRRRLRARLAALPNPEFVGGHVPVSYEGPFARLVALLDASLGELDAAQQKLEVCLARAEQRGHNAWVAQLRYDLGRVLIKRGERSAGVSALTSAATLAEELDMTGLARRARGRVGALSLTPSTPLQGPASSAAPAALTLSHEGNLWLVQRGELAVHVRDSRGMRLLARLVERPREEIHVLALAHDEAVESDAGPQLDTVAIRRYRARLGELQEELDEAERHADLGRADALEREAEALRKELARALGLGGVRRAGSATERARVNVQRRLKDAIARIAEAAPDLARELEAAVRTGTFCSYRP